MLAPPPPTLHIEGAAHETRIFLDHGSPRSPLIFWKRLAVGLWIGGMLLSWLVPFLLCPMAVVATGLVGFVLLADAGRTEVHRIVLRRDHIRIVRRGFTGLTSEDVPYDALESVALASQEGGRGRDAVLLRWRREQDVRSIRIGTGRESGELGWLHEAFGVLVRRAHDAGAGLQPTPAAAVVGEASVEGAGEGLEVVLDGADLSP